MSQFEHQQYKDAYLAMAQKAGYRPGAPSDGFGLIQLSPSESSDPERLDREAEDFAAHFLREDTARRTVIEGCANEPLKAFFYTVQAAQLMCGGDANRPPVKALLKMALKEIEAKAVPTSRNSRPTR
jgi:hypothetical protein